MKIKFLRSEKFRKQQFAATAQPQPEVIEYDVELTPEMAEKLIAYSDVLTRVDVVKNTADLSWWSYGGFPIVESTDPITCLYQVFQAVDKVKKEKEAEEQKQKDAFEKTVTKNRQMVLGNKEAALSFRGLYENNLRESKLDEETHNYVIKCREEEAREKTAAQEAEKTAKEQAKEKLKSWALKNGSDLLKARIEENMNWLQLANNEYFASIIPEGFEVLADPDENWLIKNATLEQIEALREVKKQFADAELKRYKYIIEGDYEYEGNDTLEHVDVINIELTSLDGSTKVFEKVLSRQSVEVED